MAEEDFSFQSCNNLDELFKRMFEGCPISEKFSLGSSKASYVVRHGLGAAVCKELVDDINKSDSIFTLLIDETTTKQVVKQMDFLIRYWSISANEVVTRYLDSNTFGHATATGLSEIVIKVLEDNGLELRLFRNLSIGGPNIIMALWLKLTEYLKAAGYPDLLPVIVCVLHIVHTGFHYGIEEYGYDVENLATDLYGWFKTAPCKRGDFRKLGEELLNSSALLSRHLNTR